MAVLLAVGGSRIALLFNSDDAVVAIASTYFWLVPFSYGTAGIIQITNSAFNAIGRPMPAVVITLLRMFVLYVPLAYLGSRWLGPVGIFGAAAIANVLMGLAAYEWTRRQCKRQTALTEIA